MTDALELATLQPEPASADNIAKDADLLGGYAYRIIQQQSKRVFKLRSPVLADKDMEDLHQMRIGTRRLRAALQLFADVIEPDAAKLEKSVGKLTKTLGLVRDIDVMQEWFTDFMSVADASAGKAAGKTSGRKSSNLSALSKKEKTTIKALLKTLKKRRKKQFAKMEKTLMGSAYKRVAKQCKRWIKQPTFSQVAQQPAISSAISRLVDPLTMLLQHPGWQLATRKSRGQLIPNKSITLAQLNQVLEQDSEQLHDLRKLIKQIRYQTEFFRRLYGITYAAQIREFRTLQKALGQLQDQLVIADFLADELGDQWSEKLPTIHKAFQSSRLEIWHQWQPLQEKYLKISAQSAKAA
ncbi:MAG: CHAD domain-containing protein [Cyanobacteria bacterium J06621_3]